MAKNRIAPDTDAKWAVVIAVIALLLLWLFSKYGRYLYEKGLYGSAYKATLITTNTGVRIGEIGEQTTFPEKSYDLVLTPDKYINLH